MYWRFGHQNPSVIDHLLESGNVSLEELLEQDDLIQECKAQNPRLIEYLREPSVLQQLLSYITSDDLEDRARFKYPFIACEVIACEVWGIFESALTHSDMLVKFWEFLDRPPPLNPVQASYFAKVIGVFLMKKTNEMLSFIRSQPKVVPKLLLHMSTSAIMDLLLKIISMEESPEGKGTVQWLSEEGLMPWLVNRLDPNFDEEVHSIASQVLLDIIAISQSSHPEQPSIGTNVLIEELKSEVIVGQLVSFMLDRDAPYSSSTLINGVTIFIELIRRNNSDYDVEPLPPNAAEPAREAVDLSDLLKVLATRIEDFKDLLIVPRSTTGPILTSIGKQTPLGFERLKICEMFAELLHCSNMAVLNSKPIITVSADGTVRIPKVSVTALHHQAHSVNGDSDEEDGHNNSKDQQQDSGKGSSTTDKDTTDDHATPRTSSDEPSPSTLASSTIATLASANAIEGDVLIPVGDFLKLQFVDHHIIPTCFDLFFQFPWNNFLHTVVYDMVHQVFHRPMGDIGRPGADGTYVPPKADQDMTEGWNRRLTVSIFKDGQLTKRITDAQRLCDYECAQPKGVRLGYMGHLTYIADETVKLLELYSQTSLLSTLYEHVDLEDWWNYVSKILKETKERDAKVLGGARPNVIESHKPDHDDGNDDDYIDDNDEDYGNDFIGGDIGAGHEGDVASDQFARYLCQQITNNLPDKFGSSDEDEDDDEGNWIGEYGAENQFDRVGAPGALSDPFGNNHAMDFDSDDEDGVDEETWNAAWPTKPAEQNGVPAQLETKLVEQSEDLQGATDEKTTSTTKENESAKVNASESNTPTTAAAVSSTTPNTVTPVSTATGATGSSQASKSESDEPVVRVPAPEPTVSNGEAKNKDVAVNGGDKASNKASTGSAAIVEPVKLAPEVQAPPPLKKFVPSSKKEFSALSPSTPVDAEPSVIKIEMETVALSGPDQPSLKKITPAAVVTPPSPATPATPAAAVTTPAPAPPAASTPAVTTTIEKPKTLESKALETKAATTAETKAMTTTAAKVETDVKDTSKQLDALKLEK
ncbi:SIT4 phosphatase-associated protein-domain-containing protein [Linnemannia elongata]|nr:SIT4 phosphatase-associated protein-domain-containing protein [Linnemannia elongata]